VLLVFDDLGRCRLLRGVNQLQGQIGLVASGRVVACTLTCAAAASPVVGGAGGFAAAGAETVVPEAVGPWLAAAVATSRDSAVALVRTGTGREACNAAPGSTKTGSDAKAVGDGVYAHHQTQDQNIRQERHIAQAHNSHPVEKAVWQGLRQRPHQVPRTSASACWAAPGSH
jgi:hypothetical protein